MKRAGFRCEPCGVSADKRAIEVDHIVPREHGDEDDLRNLQALCFKCNANKTRDDQDFRVVREGINKLSGLPRVEEVNFSQPGGRTQFKALQPGELFLFKLHAPRNFIVDGGVFARSDILPVSLAWDAFGTGNGTASLAEMRERIACFTAAKRTSRALHPSRRAGTAGTSGYQTPNRDENGKLLDEVANSEDEIEITSLIAAWRSLRDRTRVSALMGLILG